MFERAKKFFRKLFGLEKPEVKYYAEVKGWPNKWEHTPSKEVHDGSTTLPSGTRVNVGYPPTCHMIRYPERIRKPGSQAIHKVSPKHFKPRPAHERKLLNPKAKLEEEEN